MVSAKSILFNALVTDNSNYQKEAGYKFVISKESFTY